MIKVSKNIKDTEKIAQDFLKKLKVNKKKATVVGLYGELGSGKTAFTQAVTKLLGVKRKVNSPTFVIMKRYEIPKFKKAGRKSFRPRTLASFCPPENFCDQLFYENIFHLDAYRLKNEKELLHLGWEEIIANPKHLIFIEWPEMIIKAMPKKHHKISIAHTKEGYRKFEIK